MNFFFVILDNWSKKSKFAAMNKKIGIYSVIVNALSLCAIALSLPLKSSFIGYAACIIFAVSFVPEACVFQMYGRKGRRIASETSTIFAGAFAAVGLIVYTAGLTGINDGNLITKLLTTLDIVATCLLALSTFFISIALKARITVEKLLKWMLAFNFILALSAYMPLFGVPAGATLQNILTELWCIYFIIIDILGLMHLFKQRG